jgi:hypothetical protein
LIRDTTFNLPANPDDLDTIEILIMNNSDPLKSISIHFNGNGNSVRYPTSNINITGLSAPKYTLIYYTEFGWNLFS